MLAASTQSTPHRSTSSRDAGEFVWLPDWTGGTAVLVASGPSARDTDLELAKGRAFVITVNTSYKLAPWADIAYGCDARWWKDQKGARGFKGALKITQDRNIEKTDHSDVRRIHTIRGCNQFHFETFGHVGWFGNGGMQAANLACQLGIKKLILVGLDLTLDNGSHWHGDHSNNLPNPRAHIVDRWRHMMDRAAPDIAAHGIEVINASARSALTAYPKMELERALC